MKKFMISALLILPLTASAVENGTYNCTAKLEEGTYQWTLELSDETAQIIVEGKIEDVLNIQPLGVWREDTDTSDGWNTKLKVERNKTALVVVADNVSNDGEIRELGTSTFQKIPNSDTYSFSFVDQQLDKDGNVIGTTDEAVNLCEKQ